MINDNKKNGFTLTELLATITIVGLLIIFATQGYLAITNDIKDKEYQSKKQYLENKAVEYATENNIQDLSNFTATRLIANGYISADSYNEDGDTSIPFITNPKDENDNLACHIITIKQENYEYIATLNETRSDCSLVKQELSLAELNIHVYAVKDNMIVKEINANPSEEISYDWTNNNIAIFIAPSTLEKKYISYSLNGETKEVVGAILDGASINTLLDNEYDNVIRINAEVLLTQKLTFYAQDKEDENNSKSVTIEVKIDKEAPTINTEIYDGFTSTDKSAIAYTSDGSGSGAKKVYITLNDDKDDIKLSTTNSYEVKDGTIKIDKANIETLGNAIYYLWAEDYAGNISYNSTPLYVKNVDKQGPSGSVTITPKKAFNSFDATISIKVNDTGIGVDGICITQGNYTQENVANNCNFSKIYNDTYIANYNFGNIDGTGQEYTLNVWIRDGVGKYSVISKKYKLYKSCDTVTYPSRSACSNICGGTQTAYAYDVNIANTRCANKDVKNIACGGMKQVEDTSSCSVVCGTGRYKVNYYSIVDNQTLCKSTYTGNVCNKPDCCSSVNWNAWGECSKKCGGGEKSRTGVSNYDSSVTCYDTTTCNTMKCCSKVKIEWGKCSKDCGQGTRDGKAYSKYDGSRCKKQDKKNEPCKIKDCQNDPPSEPSSCCCGHDYQVTGDCPSCQACVGGTCYGSACN